ncbi:MAG TPA: hypothetical protein VJ773_09830 [Gemmatimonadales bacterium]|nr:hypothetical protein [Gemmatimonadales bacterium]
MIQDGGGTVVVQVPAPQDIPPIPDFPTPAPWEMLPPQAMVMIALAFFAASAFVLWPLFRAIGRRIEGRGLADSAHLRDELMDLRERVHVLEGAQARVLEMEERLDFAERLLAERGAPARLRDPEER